jgi:hypothetical protein
MMKVYSVLRSEPYQGYDLLVVFGSRQECLDYNERETGEEVTVRRSFCAIIEKQQEGGAL